MEECLDENIQNKIYLPFLTQQNFENKQQNANNNYFYSNINEENNKFINNNNSFSPSNTNNLFISEEKCFEFSEIEENLIQQNNLLFDSNSININNLNKQKELCSSSALKITKKTVNNRGRRGSKRKNNKEFRLEKPKKTYIELIAEAINKQDSKCATLIEIYNYLREYYECFRGPNEGWKNCIRHNLSLGSYFEKLPKNPHGKIGKGHLWTFGSNYNSLIEEKQKNLISNSKRISTSTKSKTTKNNKSELINKQINEEIDNNKLLIENNSNMNNIKICSSNQIIISNNLKDNQQQLISSQINSDSILFSSNTENNENYLINHNLINNNYQFIPLSKENQQQQQQQPSLINSDFINENNNLNITNYNYCYWHSQCYIGDNGEYYTYLKALPIYYNAQNQFFNDFNNYSNNSIANSPSTQIYNENSQINQI